MKNEMENFNNSAAQETTPQYPENLSEGNKKIREEILQVYNEKGYQEAQDEITNETQIWSNEADYVMQHSDDFGASKYKESNKNINDGVQFLSDLREEINNLEKNRN